MKEDGDAVLGEVAIAPGIGLEELDLAVGAFGDGVRDPMFRVGKQAREVALQGAGASMIGGRPEWVAQKYQRSKNFFAGARIAIAPLTVQAPLCWSSLVFKSCKQKKRPPGGRPVAASCAQLNEIISCCPSRSIKFA